MMPMAHRKVQNTDSRQTHRLQLVLELFREGPVSWVADGGRASLCQHLLLGWATRLQGVFYFIE